MTTTEERDELRAQNERLTAQVERLTAHNERLSVQLATALERIAELETRLGKTSQNSSKPPSSDGLKRVAHPRRQPSGKKPGGQEHHPGQTLLRATPDTVIVHRPTQCGQCQQPFAEMGGWEVERRQVQELPPLTVHVTDHVVQALVCPQCQAVSRGTFPEDVTAAVQYGPRLRAVGVYLHDEQLVPSARTCRLLGDLLGATVAEGTLDRWVQQASRILAPVTHRLAAIVAGAEQAHGDETGIRIGGRLHWLHDASTAQVTSLMWHAKRGTVATAALGIWPNFTGTLIHDRWATYWQYGEQHALCHAHLHRELVGIAEQPGQTWANEMQALFHDLAYQARQAREQGHSQLPPAVQQQGWSRYRAVLATGWVANRAPPSPVPVPPGRGQHRPAQNLLRAFQQHADAVLAFLADLRVPLTNNQAERDLRWAKVQQKISGTFRSEAGATAFCRIRSYLGTARKQGFPVLAALTAAFQGRPLVFRPE